MGGLPRDLWILAGATLIDRAGTMALPFMVLYLTKGQGYSAEIAGIAPTLFGAGSFLAAPIGGRLSEKFGPLRIMKLALLLSGGMLVIFPLAQNLASILALTFFWAVVSETFRPASLSLTTDLVPPFQRKAAYAVTRLAVNLGMSIGPALGGFIIAYSYIALFIVDGSTALLAALILILAPLQMKSTVSHGGGTRPVGPPVNQKHKMFDRRLILFLSGLVPVGIVFFQHQTAMPIYIVSELGLSEVLYGLVFTVNTGLIILLEVPLNLALAHWSHVRTLAVGAVLTGVGFGALIFANSFLTVALTVVIWTFGEMILLPGSAAYIADIAPEKGRGAYMGMYQMSFSAAFITGPWLGAAILENFGAEVLWPLTFVLGLLSALIFLALRTSPHTPSMADHRTTQPR